MPGEPYVRASEDDAGRFEWWRARMLGGRTNHWGRISLRNGPYDFKPRSRDGLGFDWPIGYEDVAPYYDKVELLIGVYGSNEGLRTRRIRRRGACCRRRSRWSAIFWSRSGRNAWAFR